MILSAEKEFNIRFSEVDSMQIVWNGNYALFFEDAREAFGKKYNMGYIEVYKNGYYLPLVEQHFYYKSPLKYEQKAKVIAIYQDCKAAKLVFNYEVYNLTTNQLAAIGQSTQVFLDKNYQLVVSLPEFVLNWKKQNGLL